MLMFSGLLPPPRPRATFGVRSGMFDPGLTWWTSLERTGSPRTCRSRRLQSWVTRAAGSRVCSRWVGLIALRLPLSVGVDVVVRNTSLLFKQRRTDDVGILQKHMKADSCYIRRVYAYVTAFSTWSLVPQGFSRVTRAVDRWGSRGSVSPRFLDVSVAFVSPFCCPSLSITNAQPSRATVGCAVRCFSFLVRRHFYRLERCDPRITGNIRHSVSARFGPGDSVRDPTHHEEQS